MPSLHVDTAHLSPQWQQQLSRFEQRLLVRFKTILSTEATSVHGRLVATAPVDTGRLRRSFTAPTARGPLVWGTGTDLDYAPILEYGGYLRLGPRTIRVGGGTLGEGFVAGAGIYSRQAPLGFVRKALAAAGPRLRARVLAAVAETWRAT